MYNFNRDLLIDYFSTFNIDFKLLNIDIIIYNILINELNQEAKEKILDGNITYPQKCKKYNFFLFYLNKDYIKNYIESKINN